MNIATAAPARLRLALCGTLAACALALVGLAAPAQALADQTGMTWQQDGQQQSATYSDAESMESAVAALPSDALDVTVRLDSDVTTSAAWTLSRDLTLDLNGHTWKLTCPSEAPEAGNRQVITLLSGTLTVDDSSSAKSGEITYVESKARDWSVIRIVPGASLVMDAGRLAVDPEHMLYGGSSVTDSGSLTINGGSLYGNLNVYGGAAYIHGGDISNDTGMSTISISRSYQIDGSYPYPAADPSFYMDGGTVENTKNSCIFWDALSAGTAEKGSTVFQLLSGTVICTDNERAWHAALDFNNVIGNFKGVVGGTARLVGNGKASAIALRGVSKSANGDLSIRDSARIEADSCCVYRTNGVDGSVARGVSVEGGYFRYGTAAFSPNSSIVNYPEGERLSSSAISAGEYAGYHQLTSDESVDRSALESELAESKTQYDAGFDKDAGYTRAKYNAFTSAYDTAVTQDANANANQSEIDAAKTSLAEARKALSDIGVIEDGVYKVQVAALNADGSGSASASSPSLASDAYLCVKDGKGTLQVTYRQMTIFGLWGAMRHLWVYNGSTLEQCKGNMGTSNRTEARYLTWYSYSHGTWNSGTGDVGNGETLTLDQNDKRPGITQFDLPYLNDESNWIYGVVNVDAMEAIGMTDPAVIIAIDYSSAEEIEQAPASSVEQLQKQVDAAKTLKESDYTADSWKGFAEARDKADLLLQELSRTQDDVFEASGELTAAQGKLVPAAGKATQIITLSVKSTVSKTYGDQPFSLGAKAKTALSYKSSNKKVAAVDKNGKVTVRGAGTAKITVSAAATGTYKAASKTVTVKVAKAKQALKVKASAKTLKAKSLKKKAKAVKAIKVTGAKGKVSYKKASGSKKLAVNAKTGKITVKKGAKKGSYTAKVKVTAKATANYQAASKTVTVKIKVK